MRHSSFACFILSHGRPDNQLTYAALRKCGYTGKIYILIDDEDITAEKYRKKYGEYVVQFSKDEIAKDVDRADLSTDKRSILWSRNAVFKAASDLGFEHFLELDDDYKVFAYRHVLGNKLKVFNIKNLDVVFDEYLDFLDASGALAVCMGQGGDYIGGVGSNAVKNGILRKAMNVLFLRSDRPFKFRGFYNDDVNTYTTLSHQGKLFFTIPQIMVEHNETQSLGGGMTETYKENGTYVKAFYSVMMCPSAVKVAMMDCKHSRIHHQVSWNHCAPKILHEKYKKV